VVLPFVCPFLNILALGRRQRKRLKRTQVLITLGATPEEKENNSPLEIVCFLDRSRLPVVQSSGHRDIRFQIYLQDLYFTLPVKIFSALILAIENMEHADFDWNSPIKEKRPVDFKDFDFSGQKGSQIFVRCSIILLMKWADSQIKGVRTHKAYSYQIPTVLYTLVGLLCPFSRIFVFSIISVLGEAPENENRT
jgi:hypothetical protein